MERDDLPLIDQFWDKLYERFGCADQGTEDFARVLTELGLKLVRSDQVTVKIPLESSESTVKVSPDASVISDP